MVDHHYNLLSLSKQELILETEFKVISQKKIEFKHQNSTISTAQPVGVQLRSGNEDGSGEFTIDLQYPITRIAEQQYPCQILSHALQGYNAHVKSSHSHCRATILMSNPITRIAELQCPSQIQSRALQSYNAQVKSHHAHCRATMPKLNPITRIAGLQCPCQIKSRALQGYNTEVKPQYYFTNFSLNETACKYTLNTGIKWITTIQLQNISKYSNNIDCPYVVSV